MVSVKNKKRLNLLSLSGLWCLVHLCALSSPVLACAVCFGDPGSDQTKAVMWGVLLLLGVIGFVLGGIIMTIISCMRRAKKLYPSPLTHEAC